MTGLLLAALIGCAGLEAALESPYVLAPGLGAATSVVPIDDHALAVATPTGVVRVAGDGAVAPLGPPAEAVTALPGRLVTLSGDRVAWTALPGADHAEGAVSVPGARDILGFYDDSVLVLTDRGVSRLRLADAQLGAVVHVEGGRSLSLDHTPGAALIVTDTAVLRLEGGGLRPIATGLVEPRCATIDALGRRWLVHGSPAQLSRLTADGPVEVARHVGDPNDVHVGTGGLLPPTHLYLADAGGSLDYLPLPH